MSATITSTGLPRVSGASTVVISVASSGAGMPHCERTCTRTRPSLTTTPGTWRPGRYEATSPNRPPSSAATPVHARTAAATASTFDTVDDRRAGAAKG